jgi:putative Mg2+ transporter-C (MgtC) family protein
LHPDRIGSLSRPLGKGATHTMDATSLTQTTDALVKILAAYVLALPVAWDRERSGQSAGLRTFPLVATAAAAYVLIATTMYADALAQARVVEGLITGIGFIGGGAILRMRTNVHGTATAAAIWATAAIGASAAYGLYHIAVILTLLNFATLRLLRPLKSQPVEGEADGRLSQDPSQRADRSRPA